MTLALCAQSMAGMSSKTNSVEETEKGKEVEWKDADDKKIKEVDIFRDTHVRYLGYANEVGEAFRSLVHVNVVRMSYGVASAYVCADAYSKGKQASVISWPNDSVRTTKVTHAVLDTVIWQGLASVAIPGFTINRICWMSNIVLKNVISKLPAVTRRWTVTAIGLGCIPIIIKPIDRSVDLLMESTLRKWYHISSVEEHIVHHDRAD